MDGEDVVADPGGDGESALIDDDIVTTADVVALNRAVIDRSAAFARIAGTALVAVGCFGFVTFLFLVVRVQQTAQGGSGFGDSLAPGPGMLERLTLVTTQMPLLVESAAVIGLGLLMRAVADYTVARVGISLTGYEPGDRYPPEDDEPLDQEGA